MSFLLYDSSIIYPVTKFHILPANFLSGKPKPLKIFPHYPVCDLHDFTIFVKSAGNNTFHKFFTERQKKSGDRTYEERAYNRSDSHSPAK